MGKQRPFVAGLVAAVGVIALYRGRLRPWMYTWGAAEVEVTAVLPGDELVSTSTPRTTRAVTIDAPLHDVWPWLAQIGEGRAGFYSYSLLERAVGARIHNSDVIHPEWQNVRVGDTVWLAQRYGDRARQVIAAVKPMSHLVLVTPDDFEKVQRGEEASGIWSFCLRREDGWTRLIARGSGGAVGHAGFDIVHFAMEQKMLRGIRNRAHHLRQNATRQAIDRMVVDLRTKALPGSRRPDSEPERAFSRLPR